MFRSLNFFNKKAIKVDGDLKSHDVDTGACNYFEINYYLTNNNIFLENSLSTMELAWKEGENIIRDFR